MHVKVLPQAVIYKIAAFFLREWSIYRETAKKQVISSV